MRNVALLSSCARRSLLLVSSKGLGYISPQKWRLALRTFTNTHQHRARSRATVQLDDLPQGLLEKEAVGDVAKDEEPSYPTVIQGARNNMRKFQNCVLLTRVGGFYELYFEQADEYGPLLNIKVAQKRTTAGSVPMAGFPFFQLDRFLKTLVQDLGKYVAISEEFPNNASGKVKSGGLLFDRKVTRIITPGTLIDEKFLDPYENNFLLAVHPIEINISKCPNSEEVLRDLEKKTVLPNIAGKTVGLAWLDLSTGDFFTQATTLGELPSALARIGAKEIVLSDDTGQSVHQSLVAILQNEGHVVTYQSHPIPELSVSQWTPMLETAVPDNALATFTDEEIAAGNVLLAYVKEKLQGSGTSLQPPIRRQQAESMSIDKNSMRGLEVLETAREGVAKGSLLHAIRRTVTKSGARLLREWISAPSMSLEIINARLDLVTQFLNSNSLKEDIINLLRRSYDSQRLVQKFSLGKGDADDLVSLLRTIEATKGIAGILGNQPRPLGLLDKKGASQSSLSDSLTSMSRRLSLDEPSKLASRIATAIDEDGLMQSHRIEDSESAEVVALAQSVLENEGSSEDLNAMSQIIRSKGSTQPSIDSTISEDTPWIMRKNASENLQKLHQKLTDLRQAKADLTSELRDSLGAQSLTLRWTPGLGHMCHVKGAKDVQQTVQNSTTARNLRTTRTTRSFYLPEWSTLGGQIDHARMLIKAEEQRVFQKLREQVVKNLVKLRRNAAVLDELDIACSFAAIAKKQGLVRPILNSGRIHKIFGGRHPTVKEGLEEQGRSFIANDCVVGETERIWLITGPNMAGKSTFLRQNALITILAQIGCFVPAEYAEIGIVDHMFSRIGSADNLFRDQSTFMVEMLETAVILKQATPRSFVIMDEIGRGTTPEDGIAVGYACLHHLYHTNQCRALFATHFHALANMTRELKGVGCYCTDVAEGPGGSFSYVHRLRRGVNRQSHALKVARLAGIPETAISTARQILETFQPQEPQVSETPFLSAATA